MTNNIEKQSFGEAGCVIVTGTNESPTTIPVGQYCAFSCVTDVEITTALSAPLLSGTQTGVTYPAGFTLFTPIIVTATSTGAIAGTAIFYKAL